MRLFLRIILPKTVHCFMCRILLLPIGISEAMGIRAYELKAHV